MAGIPPLRKLRKTTAVVALVFLGFFAHRITEDHQKSSLSEILLSGDSWPEDPDTARLLSVSDHTICVPVLFFYNR